MIIEWIMVGIISFIILCFFIHGDTENLIKWTLNMFDVTVKGKPLDFYRYLSKIPIWLRIIMFQEHYIV